MQVVDALVLAGSSAKLGAECEALLPIHGRPMVTYVVEALRRAAGVGRIAVAGPQEQLRPLWPLGEVLLAPGGADALATLAEGVRVLEPRGWLLVATADIPLLTPAAVEHFLARAAEREEDYDFFYSVVRREVAEARFPGVRRTYVSLRGVELTGGNLFLVRPEVIPEASRRGEAILALRKSPLALARLIGLGFILKYLFHTLSLSEAERRFSALLGLRGLTVECPFPEVGVDVDKPSDLELVERCLAARAAHNLGL